MMLIVVTLLLGSVAKSLEACPGDFCATVPEPMGCITISVPLVEDKESGCVCREVPSSFSFCFGQTSCLRFPKSINISTKSFWLKSSQMNEIGPGDLAKMTHLESLRVEKSDNLTRVVEGSFRNMTKLKSLSVSYNRNWRVVGEGSFNGLVNLQHLYLISNGFINLGEVTPAFTRLPKILTLVLNENNFEKIKNKDFEVLKRSTLEELSLVSCQIEEMEEDSFRPLTNLSSLCLGENSNLDTNVLAKILKKISLKSLSLCSINLKKNSSKELLAEIAKTNISKLSLAGNPFEKIDSRFFPQMRNLEILDMRGMAISNLTKDAFVNLPSLTSLRLSGNKLASIPNEILLENLASLDLEHQNSADKTFSISFGHKFTNMKNLQLLNLSFNAIFTIELSFKGLENLKVLDLQSARIYNIVNGSFSALSKLVYLNLEDNFFLKNHPTILEDGVFNGLVNLRVLRLGGCGISSISKEATPFKDLKNLKILGLERNHLISLPSFEVLPNLRRIDLGHNSLQPWKEEIFSENHQMEEVRLLDNKLAYLTKTMMEDFKNLTKLDLRNNPFTCDCSFSWNDRRIMSLIENQTLLCAFPESATGLAVKEFIKENPHCQNLTLVIPLTLLALCLGACIISLYYFRWHLRYWLFLTRLHLSRNRKIRPSEARGHTNFIYDAFVSYSSEDRNFVIRLVTMLENYPPFVKLCVYERDFEVGTMISENVLESVAKSRKTLLIISNSYAKSQWCRWESQIAEHHRIFFQDEHGEYVDDSLILIRLGAVNDANMTPTLKYLLKTRIYLQWDAEEKRQKVFWEKLREALAPLEEVNENTYL